MRRACLCLLALLLVAAGDPDRDIREATGVSEADIAAAAAGRAVTLFEAYALAVRYAENLPLAREDLVQARSHRHQAIGAILPSLSLGGNIYFPKTSQTIPGATGARRISFPSSSVSLSARQPIVTGASEVSGFLGAAHEVRMRRWDLADAAGQLLMNVTIDFYGVLQLEKSIANNREILEYQRRMVVELRRRAAIGRSRRSDVEQTQSRMYTIQAQIVSLRSQLDESRLKLARLTGIPSHRVLVEETTLPEAAIAPADIHTLAEARWDVKAAREQAKLAEALMWNTIGNYFPTVFLEATYQLYREQPSFNRQWYASLGFTVPLIAGMVPGQIEEMRSKKRQADLNLRKIRKDAEMEIRDAWQLWENSRLEVESYRAALDAARKNYETVLNDYRLTLVTILDVLTSLEALQSAHDNYDRVELQARINRVRLGVAVNEFTGERIAVLRNAKTGGAP